MGHFTVEIDTRINKNSGNSKKHNKSDVVSKADTQNSNIFNIKSDHKLVTSDTMKQIIPKCEYFITQRKLKHQHNSRKKNVNVITSHHHQKNLCGKLKKFLCKEELNDNEEFNKDDPLSINTLCYYKDEMLVTPVTKNINNRYRRDDAITITVDMHAEVKKIKDKYESLNSPKSSIMFIENESDKSYSSEFDSSLSNTIAPEDITLFLTAQLVENLNQRRITRSKKLELADSEVTTELKGMKKYSKVINSEKRLLKDQNRKYYLAKSKDQEISSEATKSSDLNDIICNSNEDIFQLKNVKFNDIVTSVGIKMDTSTVGINKTKEKVKDVIDEDYDYILGHMLTTEESGKTKYIINANNILGWEGPIELPARKDAIDFLNIFNYPLLTETEEILPPTVPFKTKDNSTSRTSTSKKNGKLSSDNRNLLYHPGKIRERISLILDDLVKSATNIIEKKTIKPNGIQICYSPYIDTVLIKNGTNCKEKIETSTCSKINNQEKMLHEVKTSVLQDLKEYISEIFSTISDLPGQTTELISDCQSTKSEKDKEWEIQRNLLSDIIFKLLKEEQGKIITGSELKKNTKGLFQESSTFVRETSDTTLENRLDDIKYSELDINVTFSMSSEPTEFTNKTKIDTEENKYISTETLIKNPKQSIMVTDNPKVFSITLPNTNSEAYTIRSIMNSPSFLSSQYPNSTEFKSGNPFSQEIGNTESYKSWSKDNFEFGKIVTTSPLSDSYLTMINNDVFTEDKYNATGEISTLDQVSKPVTDDSNLAMQATSNIIPNDILINRNVHSYSKEFNKRRKLQKFPITTQKKKFANSSLNLVPTESNWGQHLLFCPYHQDISLSPVANMTNLLDQKWFSEHKNCYLNKNFPSSNYFNTFSGLTRHENYNNPLTNLTNIGSFPDMTLINSQFPGGVLRPTMDYNEPNILNNINNKVDTFLQVPDSTQNYYLNPRSNELFPSKYFEKDHQRLEIPLLSEKNYPIDPSLMKIGNINPYLLGRNVNSDPIEDLMFNINAYKNIGIKNNIQSKALSHKNLLSPYFRQIYWPWKNESSSTKFPGRGRFIIDDKYLPDGLYIEEELAKYHNLTNNSSNVLMPKPSPNSNINEQREHSLFSNDVPQNNEILSIYDNLENFENPSKDQNSYNLMPFKKEYDGKLKQLLKRWNTKRQGNNMDEELNPDFKNLEIFPFWNKKWRATEGVNMDNKLLERGTRAVILKNHPTSLPLKSVCDSKLNIDDNSNLGEFDLFQHHKLHKKVSNYDGSRNDIKMPGMFKNAFLKYNNQSKQNNEIATSLSENVSLNYLTHRLMDELLHAVVDHSTFHIWLNQVMDYNPRLKNIQISNQENQNLLRALQKFFRGNSEMKLIDWKQFLMSRDELE